MTLEQLSNLSDDELNRLAAEKVHGWRVRQETVQEDRDMYFGTGYETTFTDWVDSTGTFQVSVMNYTPATNRTQSGDLLAAMVGQGQGAEFEVCFRNWQRVVAFLPDGKVFAVPGISPRSETIAALLAVFAMEDNDDA